MSLSIINSESTTQTWLQCNLYKVYPQLRFPVSQVSLVYFKMAKTNQCTIPPQLIFSEIRIHIYPPILPDWFFLTLTLKKKSLPSLYSRNGRGRLSVFEAWQMMFLYLSQQQENLLPWALVLRVLRQYLQCHIKNCGPGRKGTGGKHNEEVFKQR